MYLNTLYTLTRVYVFLLVCDMFLGRRASPKPPVLTEGGCYWGERRPDRRGSRRGVGGEGGFSDAVGASPSSSLFLSVSLQNHTIPLLIHTAKPELPKLPVLPSSLLLPEEKPAGAFWLCQKVSEGRKVPIHPSDEWTRGKTAEQRRGKISQALGLL